MNAQFVTSCLHEILTSKQWADATSCAFLGSVVWLAHLTRFAPRVKGSMYQDNWKMRVRDVLSRQLPWQHVCWSHVSLHLVAWLCTLPNQNQHYVAMFILFISFYFFLSCFVGWPFCWYFSIFFWGEVDTVLQAAHSHCVTGSSHAVLWLWDNYM